VAALKTVFNQEVCPTLAWLKTHEAKVIPPLHRHTNVDVYQAIPSSPFITDTNDPFKMYQGASGQSLFRKERGGGVPPATWEWVEARVLEALALRAMHDPTAWKQTFATPQPTTRQKEFEIIMANALSPKTIVPAHLSRGFTHTWIRECIEDVIRGLDIHALSRRYVADHVWDLRQDPPTINMCTDNNTLSFQVPGDCEDSNSTVYFLAMSILSVRFQPGTFMFYIRAAILLAGVPCCVVGTSETVAVNRETHTGSGAHLFGVFIPFRLFATMTFANDVNPDDALACAIFGPSPPSQLDGALLATLRPTIIETITFTSPSYLPRSETPTIETVTSTYTMTRFYETMQCFHKNEQNITFPVDLMPEIPLGIHVDHRDYVGCMLHESCLKIYTDAIPMCFGNKTVRVRVEDDSSRVFDVPFDTKTTCTFYCTTLNDDKTAIETIGTLFQSLFALPSHVYLIAKPVTDAVQAADSLLLKMERPFVSLSTDMEVRQVWNKKLPDKIIVSDLM
jgi:hypothetical protein